MTDEEFLAEELARERHAANKERILAEARETVERLRDFKQNCEASRPLEPEKDPVAKWRKEMDELERQRALERQEWEREWAKTKAPPPEPDAAEIEGVVTISQIHGSRTDT